MLWAVMVYWIVAGTLPAVRPWKLATLACSIAAAVEFSRLLHTPQLDAFRISLAGKLLLGRFFSAWDILAYWMAIGVAAATDRVAMRTKMEGGANSE